MSLRSLFLKHPYHILPPRSQTSRLLLISGQGLLFYHWRKGSQFELIGHFPQNEDGWQFFEEELDRQVADTSPIFVMVDLVEEELRSESIPPIYGEDRRLVLQRRMERLFHDTPYRRAAHKGRGDGNKERILFSALINPDAVSQWMQRLMERQAPVAGI